MGPPPALFYFVLRSFVSALEQPIWALIVAAARSSSTAASATSLSSAGSAFPSSASPAPASAAPSPAPHVPRNGARRHPPQTLRRYRLFGRFWRSDWARFRDVWRLGLPIAITLALEITIFNAAVFIMGLFGTAALAAHAIAIQIAALSFMVPMGLAQAVTVRVGLALGRRDPAGIARAGWTSFILGSGSWG
jgi:MATE family multidrug resistance protein